MRKKRFAIFTTLLESTPRPLRILDVGGTRKFWELSDYIETPGIEIVIANVGKIDVKYPGFTSVVCDGRDMSRFKDKEFDVVFSNSAIEHVGGREDHKKFAAEIRRVGKRYFVQTPNRFFPLEPHSLFPFFQFMPRWFKLWAVCRFRMGNFPEITDRLKAVRIIDSINLLGPREIRALFPEARIHKEKFLGLTKSFIAYYWG